MKNPEPIRGIERILILRADGIGDVLNSTPAMAALCAAYPDARISVVVRPLGAEILFLNPHVDKILIYDKDHLHKGLTDRLGFIKQLQAEHYNMAITLRNSSQSNLMANLSWARYRVGRKWPPKMFGCLLTYGVKSRDPKGTKHEVDRNMDIMRLVGAKNGTGQLILRLSEEERVWARGFLRRQRVEMPLVGIHPGGSSFDKLWPAENFAQAADRLMQKYRSQTMLFGGPGEDGLVGKINEMMKQSPIPATGLRLRQFAALVENCSLFICNDSGPMHVAAALKVPTVAIFGPTDHIRWRPRNEKAVVVRKDMDCWPCSAHKCKREFECIKSLPVSDVLDAGYSMLDAGYQN